MPKRLRYHFEPQKGWMNDPNGLIQFGGWYHAFFQHNPYAPKWDRMHWGHAVSRDLIHWEEWEIALWPEEPYEDGGGCFSGSAIEKDGLLYLFYTSVSEQGGQTQSAAISRDGRHFEKMPDNPLIRTYPADGSAEFRDPKVFRYGTGYGMVCGSGKDGIGKVLLYRSDDLRHWEYEGVLYESRESSVLECPDLFPLGDRYVLMFSKIGHKADAVEFVAGTFDGQQFWEESRCVPESGPQFYAPQTFCDAGGRRIVIGWMYDCERPLDAGAEYAGALTIPRELSLRDGMICNYPVEEARSLLTDRDDLVQISGRRITIDGTETWECSRDIEEVSILRDTKTLEVFINQGEHSFTYWFEK